ncbi:MAG: membrane protein of unknown function [Promethearchaeota archaeon]|nr:MAG: membrane protein of unknown function [Candidatus Lokiarchaeota archaeon]
MEIKIENLYRFAFILGAISILFSIFLDYYFIQIYDSSGLLILELKYNPIFGWRGYSNELNMNLFKFLDVSENPAIIFIIVYIPTIIISMFSVLFKDFQTAQQLSELNFYSYINLFLTALTFFIIFVFPVSFLLDSNLYFPFLIVNEVDCMIKYSIDLGYIILLTSFLLIFPYSIVYYIGCHKYQIKNEKKQRSDEIFIKNEHEKINFDKLIAEESGKLGRTLELNRSIHQNEYMKRRSKAVP